jgi:hypothetical protein
MKQVSGQEQTQAHLLERFEVESRSVPNGELPHLIARQAPPAIWRPL